MAINTKIESVTFPNYGYFKTQTPLSVQKSLVAEIESILDGSSKKISHNKMLAGNLEEQYALSECRSEISEWLAPFASAYMKHYDYGSFVKEFLGVEKCSMKLGDLWLNLQKKHEFNPVHYHLGIFSFVTWVKIPYDLAKELSMFPSSGVPMASMFQFLYTNSLGQIQMHNIPLDKENEWDTVFFPAGMRHAVYPFFTSDEVRISVSGNIVVKDFSKST